MITAEDLIIDLKEEEQKYFKLATVVELFVNETAKIKFDGEDITSEKQYAYLKSYIPSIDDRVLLASVGGTYIILGKVNYDESPNTEEEIDRYLFDLKKVIMQKGLSVTGNTDLQNLSAEETAIDGDLGVSGEVIAQKVSASGQMSAGSANVSGQMSAGSANVSGQMSAGSASINGGLTTGESSTIGGSLTVNNFFTHKGTGLGFFGKGPGNQQRINKITAASPDNVALKNKINEIIAALHWNGYASGS